MILSCICRIYNTYSNGMYAAAYDINNIKGFRNRYLPIYLVRFKKDITTISSVRKRDKEIFADAHVLSYVELVCF